MTPSAALQEKCSQGSSPIKGGAIRPRIAAGQNTDARYSRAGQMLIEAMVAIGIVVVGMFGVLSFIYSSLSLNRVVAEQLTATYLASEGIEIAKNILDSNKARGLEWNNGFADGEYEVDFKSLNLAKSNNRELLFEESTGLYGYSGGSKTNFIRKIAVTNVSSDEIKVNSVVSWFSRGGQFEVSLEDHFFNWRP